MRYDDFWLLQGWLYRLEMDGSSQAKLLLDRFVARAAELKIPVSRIKAYNFWNYFSSFVLKWYIPPSL